MYKATDVGMAILVWVYFQKLLSMRISQYIKNNIEGKSSKLILCFLAS